MAHNPHVANAELPESEEPGFTTEYRLSRTEMARLAALEYLVNFWWVAAGVPLFGIVALIFGRGTIMEVIGMSALLWPFSIPARSVLATSKSSRLFTGGVEMAVFEDRLEFRGQTPEKSGRRLRMKLDGQDIRDAKVRGRFILVRTAFFGFVPIPAQLFRPPNRKPAFLSLLTASSGAPPRSLTRMSEHSRATSLRAAARRVANPSACSRSSRARSG